MSLNETSMAGQELLDTENDIYKFYLDLHI